MSNLIEVSFELCYLQQHGLGGQKFLKDPGSEWNMPEAYLPALPPIMSHVLHEDRRYQVLDLVLIQVEEGCYWEAWITPRWMAYPEYKANLDRLQ
jgi:hypothetical protein